MGMFKRRKSSESAGRASPNSASSYPAYGSYDNVSPRSSASAPVIGYNANNNNNNKKKNKKKGFGSKIKGFVKGGRRSLSAGNSIGDNKSVDSRGGGDNDSYDNGSSLLKPPPKVKRMPHRLEKEESSSYSSDYDDSSDYEEDDHFHNQLGTVTEVNEDDYDSDGELRVVNKPKHHHHHHHLRQSSSPASSPSATTNTTNTRRINPSRSQRLGGGIRNQHNFVETTTISVVILLVDPTTKKFELIQLQPNHNQRQELTIKKVLKQFKKTITEPTLSKLSYVGLVDRHGIVYKPSALLSTAMGGSFDKTKDILVGLVRGVQSTDQLLQDVRPILGDPKMGKLLDMNGFDTKGWVKKKKTKDSILDKKKPSLVQEEKQGSALLIFAFILVVLAILWWVDKLLVHLDSSGAFVQPLMDWPIIVENAGDIAKQGVQAAKEAYFEGNNTALKAMANSTYAAVEETALEAVSDTRAIVKDLVPIVQEYVTTLDSAKDMVMMAALPVAEVVTGATTNVKEVVAEAKSNFTESIANVTESIIAANISTKEAVAPNSVWEDYVLIGLLVCWLLYWMAI